jgi:hypothetical protein
MVCFLMAVPNITDFCFVPARYGHFAFEWVVKYMVVLFLGLRNNNKNYNRHFLTPTQAVRHKKQCVCVFVCQHVTIFILAVRIIQY